VWVKHGKMGPETRPKCKIVSRADETRIYEGLNWFYQLFRIYSNMYCIKYKVYLCFQQKIAQKLQQTQNWQEKLIFTKTLGNAGLLEGVPLIKNIITSKQKSNDFVRCSAIYALRKMARSKPQFVS